MLIVFIVYLHTNVSLKWLEKNGKVKRRISYVCVSVNL